MKKNYAVAPGEYLAEWINDEGLSQQQAADQIGCSRKQVNQILNGHAPISEETALMFGRVTGIPSESWLRWETAYRSDLARLRDEQNLAQHIDEIDQHAAKYLRELGFTNASKRRPGHLVSDFLAFHKCGTWAAYEELHTQETQGEYALAALKETRREVSPTALSIWLRAGELTEAFQEGKTLTYDASALTQFMPDLRKRAATPDRGLLRDLAGMLRECGVVLQFVRPPQRFPLYGVTRWIDCSVPVIQQTARRRKDGFIIWTLFHELGHVLNDPRGEMHLDFITEKHRNSAAEKGANAFAHETLFGAEGLSRFRGLTVDEEICAVAREVGVAPGVAVHQMHRKRMLTYRQGNALMHDLGQN